MKKGLPNLRFQEGKWRGTIPVRHLSKVERTLLESKERTGEPFPSYSSWSFRREPGYGKAKGSYTEAMRVLLWAWMSKKGQGPFGTLVFDYKLSRKTIITVSGTRPFICHSPYIGKGSKGMSLEISVFSIDGKPVKLFWNTRQRFAWNRILERENFLALPEGQKELNQCL